MEKKSRKKKKKESNYISWTPLPVRVLCMMCGMTSPWRVLPFFLPFNVNISTAVFFFRDKYWSKEEKAMIQVHSETFKVVSWVLNDTFFLKTN